MFICSTICNAVIGPSYQILQECVLRETKPILDDVCLFVYNFRQIRSPVKVFVGDVGVSIRPAARAAGALALALRLDAARRALAARALFAGLIALGLGLVGRSACGRDAAREVGGLVAGHGSHGCCADDNVAKPHTRRRENV